MLKRNERWRRRLLRSSPGSCIETARSRKRVGSYKASVPLVPVKAPRSKTNRPCREL